MLYKMYYKSNIELIHLFVTKTKCNIFLQVNTFNKKISIFFSGISRPDPVPSRSRSERDKFGTGWDTGRKPVLYLFRDRTQDRGVPILSRPKYINMCFYIIFLKKCMCMYKYT